MEMERSIRSSETAYSEKYVSSSFAKQTTESNLFPFGSVQAMDFMNLQDSVFLICMSML